MRRRALLMGGKQEPNMIIGGVGSVITTKSALATKLGISESIIRKFEVVGSDVHCKITSNYSIDTDAFNGDLNITKYVDLDGRVENVRLRSFQSSSIKNIYFPNAIFNQAAFAYCSQLINDEYGDVLNYNLAVIGQESLRGTKIPTININSATSTGNNTLYNWIGESINFYGTTIGNSAFRDAQFNYANFPNVTFIDSLAFYNSQAALTLSFPSIITLDNLGQTFRLNARTKVYNFDNLNEITSGGKDQLFRSNSQVEEINFKKLKILANPAADDSMFQAIKVNCTIRTNEAMLTANAGSPHAALVWVKANRAATVEFYDDSGNYVSTL